MTVTTDECVDCGLPCISTCRYKNVTMFYCDKCKEETQLYYYDGQELCIDCIEKILEKVEV